MQEPAVSLGNKRIEFCFVTKFVQAADSLTALRSLALCSQDSKAAELAGPIGTQSLSLKPIGVQTDWSLSLLKLKSGFSLKRKQNCCSNIALGFSAGFFFWMRTVVCSSAPVHEDR